MGHTTQIFAVDLTRLRGFFGSRDATQLAELYAANVEELDSLNDRFGDQIDSDDEEWPLAEDALAEICAGQCSSNVVVLNVMVLRSCHLVSDRESLRANLAASDSV